MSFSRLSIYGILLFITCLSCRKAAFDDYYGRPDWLASPIYQQLDSMGDFTSFLYCIDLSGYKNTLGSAASWTVFAPTDAAFEQFMQERGISELSKIDKTLAEKIVRYAMVYDGEQLERLGSYFSRQGWLEGLAFRRRTVYYDFVEDEVGSDGKLRKIIATNRTVGQNYVETDNNSKYVTYFLSDYMNAQGLTARDYNAFYPNSTYTGRNVGEARIDDRRYNIPAENGYIHVVDRVLFPPQSIDQYLRNKTEYSEFNKILNLFATYLYNPTLSEKHKVLTGKTDSAFIKLYTDLALALNSENYLKEDPNDGQINNFSVLAPSNAQVLDYMQRILLKYYPAGTTLKDLYGDNSTVLVEFLNAHLYNTQLWPSKFNNTANVSGEPTKLSTDDILETKLLSNGAFYGVGKVQHANVFQSVYGNVLLDPKYSLMRIGLERLGMHLSLRIPSIRYMLVMASDEALNRMGFDYDSYNQADPIRFRGGNGTPELRKVLNAHIIPLGSDPIPNLGSSGLLETNLGEYVKFENGQMTSSGRQDSLIANRNISIASTYLGDPVYGNINGVVVYADGILTSSVTNVGRYFINQGAENTSSPYYQFYRYLRASSLYSPSDDRIQGVELGLNYTMLVPTNEAIQQAITNGDLPSDPATTDVAQRERIGRFLQYHIVRNNAFVTDGKKRGTFQTVARDAAGDYMTIQVVTNQPTNLVVRDNTGANVSLDVARSNGLAQRTMVHVLNGYLNHGL